VRSEREVSAAVTTRIGVGVGCTATAISGLAAGVGVTSLATIFLEEWQLVAASHAVVARTVIAIGFLMRRVYFRARTLATRGGREERRVGWAYVR
jgi:tetrahydromethanopterin S-methyltransferase subunit D